MIGTLVPQRLRAGELTAGTSALALLAFMFLVQWYGSPSSRAGGPISVNGWHGLTHLRWLVLASIVACLGLVLAQAAARAPAVPASLSLIVTVLGTLTLLALIYRVLIDVPGTNLDRRGGAFLGLLASIGIAYGGYASLRREGVLESDAPAEIERIVLDRSLVDPSNVEP
ncbi:MAG: hypothetical protein ACR2LV_05630 [Solirubrobacteraceae bacterium]